MNPKIVSNGMKRPASFLENTDVPAKKSKLNIYNIIAKEKEFSDLPDDVYSIIYKMLGLGVFCMQATSHRFKNLFQEKPFLKKIVLCYKTCRQLFFENKMEITNRSGSGHRPHIFLLSMAERDFMEDGYIKNFDFFQMPQLTQFTSHSTNVEILSKFNKKFALKYLKATMGFQELLEGPPPYNSIQKLLPPFSWTNFLILLKETTSVEEGRIQAKQILESTLTFIENNPDMNSEDEDSFDDEGNAPCIYEIIAYSFYPNIAESTEYLNQFIEKTFFEDEDMALKRLLHPTGLNYDREKNRPEHVTKIFELIASSNQAFDIAFFMISSYPHWYKEIDYNGNKAMDTMEMYPNFKINILQKALDLSPLKVKDLYDDFIADCPEDQYLALAILLGNIQEYLEDGGVNCEAVLQLKEMLRINVEEDKDFTAKIKCDDYGSLIWVNLYGHTINIESIEMLNWENQVISFPEEYSNTNNYAIMKFIQMYIKKHPVITFEEIQAKFDNSMDSFFKNLIEQGYQDLAIEFTESIVDSNLEIAYKMTKKYLSNDYSSECFKLICNKLNMHLKPHREILEEMLQELPENQANKWWKQYMVDKLIHRSPKEELERIFRLEDSDSRLHTLISFFKTHKAEAKKMLEEIGIKSIIKKFIRFNTPKPQTFELSLPVIFHAILSPENLENNECFIKLCEHMELVETNFLNFINNNNEEEIDNIICETLFDHIGNNTAAELKLLQILKKIADLFPYNSPTRIRMFHRIANQGLKTLL